MHTAFDFKMPVEVLHNFYFEMTVAKYVDEVAVGFFSTKQKKA